MKKSITALTLIVALVLSLAPCVAFGEGEIAVGNSITFGKYNGQPIDWRCIAVDDNGYLMLSENVLTLKCFDPAGTKLTDNYNTRAEAGSDYWPESALRTWLNSDDDVVRYSSGHTPDANSVRDGLNPYDGESGFLNADNFTPEEVDLIVETDVASVVSHNDVERASEGEYIHQYKALVAKSLANYSSAYKVTSTDKMFLPSIEDITTIAADTTNFTDEFHLARPTGYAISTADGLYDELTLRRPYYFWTRDALAFSTGEHVRVVAPLSSKYNAEAFAEDFMMAKGESRIESAFAYNGSIGVRPAFYLTKEIVVDSGDGSKESPYTVRSSAPVMYITSEIKSAVTGTTVDFDIYSENIPDTASFVYTYNGEVVSSNKGLTLNRPENCFVVSVMDGDNEIAYDEAIVRTANYAGAEVTFNEYFESGATPPANLIGDWSAAYSRYEEALDGQALKLIGSNGAGVSFKNTKIAGKSGIIVIEASVAFEDFDFVDGSPIFTLNGRKKSDGTAFSIAPIVATADRAIALSGSSSDGDLFTSILPGERLDIRLIVNTDLHTVSVMVNDIQCAADVKLDMADFDSFDELVIGSLNTNNTTASYLIDNLSVKTMAAESALGYVIDSKGLRIYNPLGISGDAIVYLALNGEVVYKENITLSATEDVYINTTYTGDALDKLSVFVWTPDGMVPYDISRKIGW